MKFEWDQEKNVANIERHGVDFSDAPELFDGPRLTFPDVKKEYGEQRYISLGVIKGRLMVVVHTQRGESIRIISLRKANSREKAKFEKAVQDRLGQG